MSFHNLLQNPFDFSSWKDVDREPLFFFLVGKTHSEKKTQDISFANVKFFVQQKHSMFFNSESTYIHVKYDM